MVYTFHFLPPLSTKVTDRKFDYSAAHFYAIKKTNN